MDYSIKNVPCSSLTGETPVINTKGKFFPCSNELDEKKYCIGEIKNNKIIYYNNKGYSDIYKAILETKCNNCKSFYFCGGGCSSSIIRDENGNINEKSKTVCSMINYFWDIVFTNLIKDKYFLDMKLVRNKNIKNYEVYEIIKEKVF